MSAKDNRVSSSGFSIPSLEDLENALGSRQSNSSLSDLVLNESQLEQILGSNSNKPSVSVSIRPSDLIIDEEEEEE